MENVVIPKEKHLITHIERYHHLPIWAKKIEFLYVALADLDSLCRPAQSKFQYHEYRLIVLELLIQAKIFSVFDNKSFAFSNGVLPSGYDEQPWEISMMFERFRGSSLVDVSTRCNSDFTSWCEMIS
ncbi:hypothetical protein STEG23_016810 [Scotinomys teguina]